MKLFDSRPILCPTDFSESSVWALHYAGEFARCFGAKLFVIYADYFTLPPYLTAGQRDNLVKSIADAKDGAYGYLVKWVEGYTEDQALKAEMVVVEDRPVPAILGTAEKIKAGLLVMGAHGIDGFNRFLLGATTERILFQTDIPVLSVDSRPILKTPSSSIKRILCPIDFSEVSFKALDLAADIAACFRAELMALHVTEGNETEAGSEQLVETVCAGLTHEQRTECRLQGLVRREGDTAGQIIDVSLSKNCDMIVLGGQHRPFLDTTVVGKTTLHVTRHATCPVLTVMSKKDRITYARE